MSASEALKTAQAIGIMIGLDGDDLVLEASTPPPAAVLDAVSRHKAGIVALLRPPNDAGLRRTGRCFSMSVPASPSSTGNCRARKRKRAPSSAASSNGSTAIRNIPTLAGAPGAGSRIGMGMPSFPSGRRITATPGCIPSAGTTGVRTSGKGRYRLSRPWA